MNKPNCEHCPCPDICLARAAWCEKLEADPADERFRRHIVGRSRVEAGYPPTLDQVGNALAAAGRVLKAAVCGAPIRVDAEEQARRLAICEACPEYDPEQKRCRKCGCVSALKRRLATEHCPLDPPRW